MRVRKSVRALALLLCLSLMAVPVKVSAYDYDYVERPTLEYHDNGDLKNVTFMDGNLIRYNSDGGHIVIMTNRLRSVVEGTKFGDFTDYGFYGRNFEDFAAVEENERLNKTFGIVAHTELLLPNQSSISISLQERVISKSKPGVYYMYLWTQYRGHCYPDQLLARITVKDTGITVDPATSINACNDERYFYIVPPAHMTRDPQSGEELQQDVVKGSAIVSVIYTADPGYYFPDNYSVSSENGIAVTRNSESQITVSGTPTADTVIQLTAPEKKVVTYNVTVIAADHMKRETTSGLETQSGLTGAMTDVVYTAEDGYYFPDSYPVPTVNGITVTRNGENQITVSGTPTANTEIKLTAPTEKNNYAAVNRTSTGNPSTGNPSTGNPSTGDSDSCTGNADTCTFK